jgi:hypothetical protein
VQKTEKELQAITVKELQKLCTDAGLNGKGRKVQRLPAQRSLAP